MYSKSFVIFHIHVWLKCLERKKYYSSDYLEFTLLIQLWNILKFYLWYMDYDELLKGLKKRKIKFKDFVSNLNQN